MAAAKAADDTLTDEEAIEPALFTCLPAAAAGQCTAADATLVTAWAAALPCDDDVSTPDASDDCPSTEAITTACELCVWVSGEVADINNPAAAELEAALAICDPDLVKLSGSAGLVVSLALASVSAAATQL
eukprot:COSAG02_NODE_13938_length_1329_cov_0.945528_1_plen_131_part_00